MVLRGEDSEAGSLLDSRCHSYRPGQGVIGQEFPGFLPRGLDAQWVQSVSGYANDAQSHEESAEIEYPPPHGSEGIEVAAPSGLFERCFVINRCAQGEPLCCFGNAVAARSKYITHGEEKFAWHGTPTKAKKGQF